MKKLFIISLLMLSALNIYAVPAQKNTNQLQTFSGNAFDAQRNTVSNVDFFNSNFGMFGNNMYNNSAGLFWPRGSQNMYIYAGGVWFGTQKTDASNQIHTYCEVSYDPNTGSSWMTPGSIDDGNLLKTDLISKNRLYLSTDYNLDGTPKANNWGANWPLWITDNTQQMQYGTYIHTYENDTLLRNSTQYPMGPLFVSDEDMYSIFKDTDLSNYVGGAGNAQINGYPLNLQYEQNVYSWASPDLQDIIILFYTIENKSNDTLNNCWFAPMFDTDLLQLQTPMSWNGASNDRCRYFNENPDLNLAVMWTESNYGEEGKGFGYMGCSFIESPAVDENGFIRHDQAFYEPSEQLGLKSFKNWNLAEDLIDANARYAAMSSQYIDGEYGPGDKRLMMATGPFNMLPGDKARVAVALSFAMPAKGGEADGTTEDIVGSLIPGKCQSLQANNKSLVEKLNKLQAYYYQSILKVDNNNIIVSLNIDGIYPNPASKVISINYQLQKSAIISLGLYNQLGEEVQNLFSGFKSAGKQSGQFQLNTQAFSDGMYYIKIQSGTEIKTKTVSIIK